MSLIRQIAGRLGGHGLILRGGFDFTAEDAPPPGPDGAPARSVLLVGHGGPEYWRHFQAWMERQQSPCADPLDQWAASRISPVAEVSGARAVYPSDRPYLPFQQWAMRSEGLRPSPLGMLIHPEYGLWHAYRAALLFSRKLNLPPAPPVRHPCNNCAERPCLTACPVEAHRLEGLSVETCRAHLAAPAGIACRQKGCLSRNACPVGAQWRLPAAVQAFHLAAFAVS